MRRHPPAAGPDSNGRPGALDLCGHCTLAAERFAPLLPSWPVLAAVVASWPTPFFFSTDLRSAEAPRAAARGPPLRGCFNGGPWPAFVGPCASMHQAA